MEGRSTRDIVNTHARQVANVGWHCWYCFVMPANLTRRLLECQRIERAEDDGNVRFTLSRWDMSNIRRAHRNAKFNINVREKAERTLDDVFGATSSHHLKVAAFHYAALTTETERFELGIATPAMLDAAWAYAHGKLLMMDGTFGITKQKILLFVVIALDESRRGVPVALLLFSAPRHNALTAAGYNTEILAKMLESFKKRAEEFHHEKMCMRKEFTPKVRSHLPTSKAIKHKNAKPLTS